MSGIDLMEMVKHASGGKLPKGAVRYVGNNPGRHRVRTTLSSLKKWLLCSWWHDGWKCFPEVWDRGLDGPWHCMKCHPCGEELNKFLGRSAN